MWEHYEPRIQAALEKHFPDITKDVAKQAARAVYETYDAASAYERIERSNKPSSKDAEHLKGAARDLHRAAKRLSQIGWHGGGELRELALEILSRGQPGPPLLPRMDAPQTVKEEVARLAKRLEEAAAPLEADPPPVFDYLDEKPPSGPPTKTAAFFAAQECADVYRRLSSKEPTVRVDHSTNRAYGPFLNLLKDIFNALDLKASAEAMARAVLRKEASPGRVDS